MYWLTSVSPRYLTFGNSDYVSIWTDTFSVVIVEYLVTGSCNAVMMETWDFCFLDNSHLLKTV